jgi:hypothetical protein
MISSGTAHVHFCDLVFDALHSAAVSPTRFSAVHDVTPCTRGIPVIAAHIVGSLNDRRCCDRPIASLPPVE